MYKLLILLILITIITIDQGIKSFEIINDIKGVNKLGNCEFFENESIINRQQLLDILNSQHCKNRLISMLFFHHHPDVKVRMVTK